MARTRSCAIPIVSHCRWSAGGAASRNRCRRRRRHYTASPPLDSLHLSRPPFPLTPASLHRLCPARLRLKSYQATLSPARCIAVTSRSRRRTAGCRGATCPKLELISLQRSQQKLSNEKVTSPAEALHQPPIGIEDQLKKSKFLGHLPLHCLPFDFL